MKLSQQLEMFNRIKLLIELEICAASFRVTSGHWKNCILLSLTGIVLIFGNVLVILHFMDIFRHGLNLNLMMTMMIMVGYTQIISKIIFGSFEQKKFIELFQWIESLYEETESDPDLQFALEKHLMNSIKIWKFLKNWGVGVFMVASIFTCLNMKPQSVMGPVMDISLLMPDIRMHEEISYVLQLICIPVASIFAISADLGIVFIGLQLMAAVNILNDCIKLVNEKIRDNPNYLKIVINRHCNVIKNIYLFIYTIRKISFIQFLSGTLILILDFAFMMKDSKEIAPYIICICAVMQIFTLCIFGEFIKIKTDQLSTTMYLTNWYELSLKDQKTFLLILRMAQREYGLKAAGMYDVNIYAFIQIMKMAISYCAILYAMAK